MSCGASGQLFSKPFCLTSQDNKSMTFNLGWCWFLMYGDQYMIKVQPRSRHALYHISFSFAVPVNIQQFQIASRCPLHSIFKLSLSCFILFIYFFVFLISHPLSLAVRILVILEWTCVTLRIQKMMWVFFFFYHLISTSILSTSPSDFILYSMWHSLKKIEWLLQEPLLKIEINNPALLAGNWSQLCATCKVLFAFFWLSYSEAYKCLANTDYKCPCFFALNGF